MCAQRSEVTRRDKKAPLLPIDSFFISFPYSECNHWAMLCDSQLMFPPGILILRAASPPSFAKATLSISWGPTCAALLPPDL